MDKIKVLHAADLHFSMNAEMLEESVTTTDALLVYAHNDRPDVIVLAGDSVDEYVGRIPVDSPCARAAISFVERAADIAPVIIIRGTKSHDRETPALFSHLRGYHTIFVATDVQQVALVEVDNGYDPSVDFPDRDYLFPVGSDYHGGKVKAIFTLVPSLDKSHLMARSEGSIREGNFQFKEAVHDMFAGLGLVNDQFTAAGIPTVLVSHGMVTGAQFSSGQTAVGEDLEFGVSDLQAAKCSAVMLGHVHKFQTFPGNIAYSGSPGRLNFGEPEEKGFLLWEFEGAAVSGMSFCSTPARRFVFGDVAEYLGVDDVYAQAGALALTCVGADVRFRVSIPEESRQELDRDRLQEIFTSAGARRIKLEVIVIPKQRSRAEGISRVDGLTAKVIKWGATVGEEIPADVLDLSGVIEGLSVEELIASALETRPMAAAAPVPDPAPAEMDERTSGIMAAMQRNVEAHDQASLF